MTDHTATWKKVSTLLRDAYAELPPTLALTSEPMTVPAVLTGTAKEFLEFVEHNELELAWDTLAELGRRSRAGETFWLKLVGAASGMNLHGKGVEAMAESINHRT